MALRTSHLSIAQFWALSFNHFSLIYYYEVVVKMVNTTRYGTPENFNYSIYII